MDEAYAPFARENAVGLLAGHQKLVVVRTLSKAYALAGIRVGYALADAGVIALLDRVRDSYNVSRLSQAAALAALGDQDHQLRIVAKMKATRDLYMQELERGEGLVHLSVAGKLRLHGAAGRPRPHRTRGRAGRPSTSCSRARCWCATFRATP